jgi:CubicO group peptidase (beta-lactamase class C family)
MGFTIFNRADPSTHWKYGASHDVLAALIEVLSGQTFGDFLKKELFEPFGDD